MIMDFSKPHADETKQDLDERLGLFAEHLRKIQAEQLVVNLHTNGGSKLLSMRILQIIGDTLYLTDEFESMAIIDFSHIKFIELVD